MSGSIIGGNDPAVNNIDIRGLALIERDVALGTLGVHWLPKNLQYYRCAITLEGDPRAQGLSVHVIAHSPIDPPRRPLIRAILPGQTEPSVLQVIHYEVEWGGATSLSDTILPGHVRSDLRNIGSLSVTELRKELAQARKARKLLRIIYSNAGKPRGQPRRVTTTRKREIVREIYCLRMAKTSWLKLAERYDYDRRTLKDWYDRSPGDHVCDQKAHVRSQKPPE